MLSQEGGPEEVKEAKEFAQTALKLCSHSQNRGSGDKAQRFDSSMAESTQLIGTTHLKSGEVGLACDHLLDALKLVTLSEGTSSLRVAEILEDLSLALIRQRCDTSAVLGASATEGALSSASIPSSAEVKKSRSSGSLLGKPKPTLAESLLSFMVPKVEAIGASEDPLRKLLKETDVLMISDEDAIDAMLQSALAIRRKKNGPKHVRVGHSLIRLTELYWAQGRYSQIGKLYAEATNIFAASEDDTRKEVSQLASWSAVATLLIGNLKKAESENDKAASLATKAFGASSWEMHRLMMDKVRICQALVEDGKGAPKASKKGQGGKVDEYLTEASKGKGTPANEALRQKTAKSYYAKAERYETQATLMYASLMKDQVKDDVLPSLSFFAPIYRGHRSA